MGYPAKVFVRGSNRAIWSAIISFTQIRLRVLSTSTKQLPEFPGSTRRSFTVRIKDLAYDESDAILEFLYQHMTKPQFFYRHSWRPRDLVLWDNRALMHCAVGDYSPDQRRHMHRTTIMD